MSTVDSARRAEAGTASGKAVPAPAALAPGQFDEMVADIRRALHRFLPGRNGDPKAGMAYTLLTVLSRTGEERQIALSDREGSPDSSRWMDAGVVTQCNRTIHSIYFTLVDEHVIKPGHPEREKS